MISLPYLLLLWRDDDFRRLVWPPVARSSVSRQFFLFILLIPLWSFAHFSVAKGQHFLFAMQSSLILLRFFFSFKDCSNFHLSSLWTPFYLSTWLFICLVPSTAAGASYYLCNRCGTCSLHNQLQAQIPATKDTHRKQHLCRVVMIAIRRKGSQVEMQRKSPSSKVLNS